MRPRSRWQFTHWAMLALAAAGTAAWGDGELDRGDRLFDQGKPAEALQVWEQALPAQPASTKLLLRIATAQGRLGRLADAEATLDRAVAIEPRDPKVRHNLALVYLKQRNLEKALAAFHSVLAIQDTYPTANYFIGLIHEMRGDEATAETFYVREVNSGACLEAWECLWRLNEKRRAEGKLPPGPEPRNVVLFSVALLALAGFLYGLRLFLEARRRDETLGESVMRNP